MSAYNIYNIYLHCNSKSITKTEKIRKIWRNLLKLLHLNQAKRRSIIPEVFCKIVSLKILQKSHENNCTGVSLLIKLPQTVIFF